MGQIAVPVYRLNKESGLLEVIFKNGEESITFRKAKGNEDISGDYTLYDSETKVRINGRDVTLKGSDACYTLAIWTDADSSYSLSLSHGKTQWEWQTILAEES